MIEIYQKQGCETTLLEYESFNFPAGERHVKLNLSNWFNKNLPLNIDYIFDGNESIIELLLVCDAIERSGYKLGFLWMSYCPFAQQDRVMVPGEPLSIKVFAKLINSLEFKKVTIVDPHSDVAPALINNCEILAQHEIFKKYFDESGDNVGSIWNGEPPWLICPDAGALKKIHKLAAIVQNIGVVLCEKERDVKTGKILQTIVHHTWFEGNPAIIVDDLCIGGRTFIEIAKILKQPDKCCGKIVLMVTHGVFKDGLGVFDGLIDEIYTKDGRVK